MLRHNLRNSKANRDSQNKSLSQDCRTNQIRIHAAFKGYPLVGDITYHPDENVFPGMVLIILKNRLGSSANRCRSMFFACGGLEL